MNLLDTNTAILAKTLLKIRDQSLMEDFLQDILTPAEINSMVERLRVVELLLKGESQRAIAQKLNCSITTVTRGNRIIQFGKQSVKQVLQ
jgi:Trp operon repressor